MGHEQSTINDLMRQAVAGDDDAFGQVADAAQDSLYRMALAHGLNCADAAEAVQETLIRAYTRRRKWHADSDVLAWMSGITMNIVREFRRKRRRCETLTLQAARAWGEDGPGGDSELQPDEAAARLAGLQRAIAALPPRQREAVTCRFLMGMSVRQTAQSMACAEGTVKAAVSAGLANLRRLMETQQ